MTLRDEIKRRWTVAQIYRLLYEEGKVPFSYQAFRLFVNRLILNPGQMRRTPKGDKPAATQAETPEPIAKQATDKAKGFVWNPNPDKEDLI